MRPFSLLVKPASADCNLDCEYCFYKDKSALYPQSNLHRMTSTVLEAMTRNFFAAPQPEYAFGWQGGEPTLMGREFFEEAFDLQRALLPDGSRVNNGLQTNGTLLDDAFAATLAAHEVLTGISIDGPPEIHDRYRFTTAGGPSHHMVIRGLDALKRNGAEFNVLVLVTQANVRRAAEVYHYLKSLGASHHQYIPCVEYDDTGELHPFAITGAEWGAFLTAVFDEWVADDTETVSVRFFDAVLEKMLTGRPGVCFMGKDCRHYFVVEHSGDVYPCDFYVEPDLLLGNVTRDRFVDLWRSPAYRAFGRAKRQWSTACEACEYLPFCAGDCPKMRRVLGERDAAGPFQEAGPSVLCEGWKHFYAHTLPRFEELAVEFRAGRLRRRV